MNRIETEQLDRIRVRLPIRVFGFDEARGRFEEDAHTIVVSPTGSLIALKHKVFAADVIRIVNMANVQEADFRIVGPSLISESEVSEWGVECTERDRNIWGIEFPPWPKNPQVLLQCRACRKQDLWFASVLEREVLERSGIIVLNCSPCGKPTYWTYVDPSQRPPAFAHAEAVAPPPRAMPVKQFVERRKRKRASVRVPVLVRTSSGAEEIGTTANLSNVGLAVLLRIDLKEDEIVSVFCPYTAGGQNIEQKAKVRWRDPYPAGPKRFYGLCYKI